MESTVNITLKEIKQMMLTTIRLKNPSMKHITEEDILVEATTEDGNIVGISNIRFSINMDK